MEPIDNSTQRVTPPPPPLKKRHDVWDRRMAVVAVATIAAAWIIGGLASSESEPTCDLDVLPSATNCRKIGNSFFEGFRSEDDGTETVVGWANVGEAQGYSGNVKVMVGVDPAGEILGVKVLDQTETPGFYARIEKSDLTANFAGMQVTSPFKLGDDVDGVTRATVTSHAITEAVRKASYTLAEQQLGLKVTRESQPIKFGIPEIALLSLYAAAYVGHQRRFKYTKQMRWATMLVGLVVLGFIYNSPLTLGHFSSLLTGAWPNWRTNLYWFLLVGGILLVITGDGKNPYCSWFCPFGAAQECLGAIGRAKYIQPRRGKDTLKWIQRGLAWLAIILALLLRNPGISSYEIFGTLFAFSGASVQWVVLIVILLLSMFVRRPWCHFLCPIDPITDLISAGRRWIRELLWPKRKTQSDVKSPMPSSSPSSDSVSS